MRHNHARGLSQATGLALVLTLVAGCSSGSGLTAWGESITVGEGGTVTTTSTGSASLLANETGGSDALRLDPTPVEAPTHGTLELNPDGTFRYTHDGSESGSDRFVYAVVDGGARATATVEVTVAAGDDPPNVQNDVYGNAVGNTFLDVGHGTGSAPAVRWESSVLLNDSDPDGALRVVSWDATSAQGGSVAMREDGTFTYLPAVAFQGDDTFTYVASDGRDSATGTVTITVGGLVWYLDNARSAAGDGRSGSPFRSVAEMGSAAAGGEPIYVSGGAGDYDGPIQLQSDQLLAGAGAAFQLLALDLPASRAPVLGSPSGSAVEMAPGSRLQGVTIGATEAHGIVGSQPGRVTIRDVRVEGGGGAVAFTGVELDVELLDVSSIDAVAEAIRLEDCTGSFRIRGDLTITNPAADGLLVANGVTPLGLDFDVDGSTAIVGPVSDGIWFSNVDGDVRFNDVTINGRGTFAIRLGGCDATFTFGDVDVPNANQAPGNAVEIAQCGGVITATSFDISGVRSAQNPGSASGIFCDSCPASFRLLVTGGGVQRDGGTIQDIQGNGVTVTGEGEIRLAAMTFDGFHQSAIGVGTNPTLLAVESCTFRNWNTVSSTLADVPAIAFQAGIFNASCSIVRSSFDGDGVANTAPVILLESSATHALEASVGGIEVLNGPELGCTFRNCATTSVRAQSLGGQMTLTVGASTWTDVVGNPSAVHVQGGVDRGLNARVVGCDFRGELALAVEIDAAGGSIGSTELLTTVSGNTGDGLQRIAGVRVANGGRANVQVAGNTLTGMLHGPLFAQVGSGGDLDLECAANSFTMASGLSPFTAPYELSCSGEARYGLRGESLLNYSSAGIPALRAVSQTAVSTSASIHATENTWSNPAGRVFVALQSGDGQLQVCVNGHASGAFLVEQQAGTLVLEDRDGFATGNPGASLSQQGTIDTAAPGSTPQPSGPYF